MSKQTTKLAIVAFLFMTLFLVANTSGLLDALSFESLKEHRDELVAWRQGNELRAAATFFACSFTVVALSLPAATAMTISAGALFPFWQAVALVSFSSTLGALASFLIGRFALRDFVHERFGDKVRSVSESLEREGIFSLLLARVVPLMPFFVINLALGVTKFSAWTFAWVSQLGMLPGTLIYVNAGKQLSRLQSPRDVFSTEVILSFAALMALPVFMRVGLGLASKKRRVYHAPNH